MLTSANDLVQRATIARDDSRFTEAERLADQANDAALQQAESMLQLKEALTNGCAGRSNAAGAVSQMIVPSERSLCT